MNKLEMPAAPRLLSSKGWTVFAVLLVLLTVLAPVLNLVQGFALVALANKLFNEVLQLRNFST